MGVAPMRPCSPFHDTGACSWHSLLHKTSTRPYTTETRTIGKHTYLTMSMLLYRVLLLLLLLLLLPLLLQLLPPVPMPCLTRMRCCNPVLGKTRHSLHLYLHKCAQSLASLCEIAIHT